MENHLIYAICAIVATLLFIPIAIYLILLLQTTTQTLKQLQLSLFKLDKKIEPISEETIKLLENTNVIAEDVQEKLSNLNPLMGSISNVGSVMEDATHSFGEDSTQHRFFHSEKKRDWQGIAGDLIKLATLGVDVWQKIKKG